MSNNIVKNVDKYEFQGTNSNRKSYRKLTLPNFASRALNMSCSFSQSACSIESWCVVRYLHNLKLLIHFWSSTVHPNGISYFISNIPRVWYVIVVLEPWYHEVNMQLCCQFYHSHHNRRNRYFGEHAIEGIIFIAIQLCGQRFWNYPCYAKCIYFALSEYQCFML